MRTSGTSLLGSLASRLASTSWMTRAKWTAGVGALVGLAYYCYDKFTTTDDDDLTALLESSGFFERKFEEVKGDAPDGTTSQIPGRLSTDTGTLKTLTIGTGIAANKVGLRMMILPSSDVTLDNDGVNLIRGTLRSLHKDNQSPEGLSEQSVIDAVKDLKVVHGDTHLEWRKL